MKFFLPLFLFILSGALHAKVEIQRYRHSSWDNSWNEAINSELSKKENSVIMSGIIDIDDLNELNCPGYNTVTDNELKKDFWVVFLSALVRSESAFNPKAHSRAPKGKTGSYGLLQLTGATARNQCGLNSKEEIADPDNHLRCGVKLLSWQLEGAPTSSGKKRRPDLEGQLFGKYILLWGPLRQNDKHGRARLTSWFKKHLDQLPFCTLKA